MVAAIPAGTDALRYGLAGTSALARLSVGGSIETAQAAFSQVQRKKKGGQSSLVWESSRNTRGGGAAAGAIRGVTVSAASRRCLCRFALAFLEFRQSVAPLLFARLQFDRAFELLDGCVVIAPCRTNGTQGIDEARVARFLSLIHI